MDIEASRLRNTWLVAAMCAPVPLADLLRAAGLRSARTIGDLLPYCPDADPAVIGAARGYGKLNSPHSPRIPA